MSEESAREAGEPGSDGADERLDGGAGANEGVKAKDQTPKLKLRRLKIHKWRNVLPGTELRFADGIHALLGKNGVGKTTLLKLLSMCLRDSFGDLKGEPFDLEYELRNEDLSLQIRNRYELGPKRPTSEPFREPDYQHLVDIEARTPRLGKVVILWTRERTRYIVDDQPERVVQSDVSPFDSNFVIAQLWRAVDPLLLKKAGVLEDVNGLAHGYAGTQRAFRFDEMLGWLDAMLGNGRKDSDLLPFTTSVTRFQAHTEARSSLLPGFLWDAEAKLREMRATNHSWLSFTPPELGFLNTFIKLAGISSAEMRLPVDDTDPAEERIRFGAPVFQFHGHGSFSIQVASYGQRRLLSFLHYGACNPSVLIADELTNGLHHEWIEACVDELKQRQSFVATQHPLLIDYLPVSCAKDAETAFIQCRLVEEHGKQWMHWRNTTPEEANQFWKSYETGVQFINEVLRTDGLW